MNLLMNYEYLRGIGASSLPNVFISIYTCFSITHTKIFFMLKGGFEILIFQVLNVLGIATTEQGIVIYHMVDFLKKDMIFFPKIRTATKC